MRILEFRIGLSFGAFRVEVFYNSHKTKIYNNVSKSTIARIRKTCIRSVRHLNYVVYVK